MARVYGIALDAIERQAMTPPTDDDNETLELLTQTPAARQAAAHQKKVYEITHGAA